MKNNTPLENHLAALSITVFQKEHLEFLYTYASQEGWYVEKTHMQCQFKMYPNDFFIAYREDTLVGFVLATKESDSLGFISTLLVLKEFRGRGYGKTLLKHAISHLGTRQIALNSIVNKENLYKKFDFTAYFDVITYTFVVGSVSINQEVINALTISTKIERKEQPPYMQCLLQQKDIHFQTVYKKNSLSSLGFFLLFKDGYKIVLQSSDINEALILFFSLMKSIKNGTPVYMEVAKTKPLLIALVEYLNMKEYERTTRMYNKILD
ncbi:GNAT family N-acetyltransferase [Sulfurimonas sp. SAG-AH-194-I05]|nr:GNAT family N-acetyltransferase [Sulfurimonas sp. SAG-AH-194-I05]MDF1874845.1 GNAT family N-acetyltransferase [Sulfurimonas sp. SAG-AH-194-I05]